MIEAINLTKKYEKHTAVRNLSFKADKGKVLGFLGPNGAGKSTTMNMLTGYLAPSSGTVLINGINVFEKPEKAKKFIGYLPEIPPVYPDMTVNEYLKFVSELKKVPKKQAALEREQVLAKVNITDVAGRLIKHLSKGYRQRVGLAAALIGNPEVLILDEPTVGLDPAQIIEIRSLIRELACDHTIILSSHILTEISAVCDELMIINRGKLIAVGTPESFMNNLSDETVIYADIVAPLERCEEIVTSIEGITSYKYVEETHEGAFTYEIHQHSDCDIREQLFKAVAGSGFYCSRLIKPVKSLEEIYLEMIEASNKAFDDYERRREEKNLYTGASGEAPADAQTGEVPADEPVQEDEPAEQQPAEQEKGGDEDVSDLQEGD